MTIQGGAQGNFQHDRDRELTKGWQETEESHKARCFFFLKVLLPPPCCRPGRGVGGQAKLLPASSAIYLYATCLPFTSAVPGASPPPGEYTRTATAPTSWIRATLRGFVCAETPQDFTEASLWIQGAPVPVVQSGLPQASKGSCLYFKKGT